MYPISGEIDVNLFTTFLYHAYLDEKPHRNDKCEIIPCNYGTDCTTCEYLHKSILTNLYHKQFNNPE